MLLWRLLSTRKVSEVLISFSSKIVSLTCSFRSTKWGLLVLRHSSFLHGAPEMSFKLGFFCDVFNGWKPNSHWRRASQAELSSSFSISSVWENHRSHFLLRICALGIRFENVLDFVYGVLPKFFKLSLLCV